MYSNNENISQQHYNKKNQSTLVTVSKMLLKNKYNF